MKKIIFILAIIISAKLNAQYSIGHTTVTFNDPARTGGFGSGGGPGRQIQCEIYYPATSTGTTTPFVTGQFPVIVFGHGFVMSWDAYQNIWERLVPEGYIMVFLRTEGSFTPSHNDFGLDMALVEQRMQLENTTSTSFFYQHVTNRSAIMGHSMGGGSTILAAQGNSNIKTIVCLAPAETSPSAIDVANTILVPSLILSGSNDGVTPSATNHQPIYDSIQTCKTFLSIPGGGHCYFANTNINCDFGEATSSTGISITRAQQQDIAQDFYSIWFDFYLKQNCNAHAQFQDSLLLSTRIVDQQNCSYTAINISGIIGASTTGTNGSVDASITGGQATYSYSWSNAATTEDINTLAPGTYTLTVTDDYGCTGTQTFTVGTTTGLDQPVANYMLSVLPNPTNDYFKLINGSAKNISVSVYTTDGKLISNLTTNSSEITLGQELTKGVYLLLVKGPENEFLKSFRLIKN